MARTAIKSGHKGNNASGWDAFDDDDLSFLESQIGPDMPLQPSMSPSSSTGETSMPLSTRASSSSESLSPSHASIFTLNRPGLRDGDGYLLEGGARPVSRPASKALFSDKDPLIEVRVYVKEEEGACLMPLEFFYNFFRPSRYSLYL